MMCFIGVLKEFQEYYKITNAEVGLMQTAFIVAYMLFSLLFGYIGDRFNRTVVISVGIFGWSIVMLLSSFVGPNVGLIYNVFFCLSVNAVLVILFAYCTISFDLLMIFNFGGILNM